VLGFGALLAETRGLPAGVQAQANAIESGGRDILHLAESLRDLSALDAGVLSLHPSPVLLSELLRQLAARYRPSAAMRGLTLALELDARCDWPLLVDGPRLTLLVRTLLENALRHTDEGQIDLVLTQLSEGSGLESVLIEVRDTGRGIAPERQRGLFQPEPESESTGPRPGGSGGFNLASCHRLASLMGLDLGLDYSLLGHGSSFFLRLEAQRCVARAESRPGHAQDSERLDGLTVLVAESEPDTQRLLSGWLSGAGAQVQLISEAAQLLQALQAPSGRAVGLVLLDLQLPGPGGLEVLRQLRAAGDQTPVIALCSSDEELRRQASLAAGASEFCPKPVGKAVLLALCQGLLASQGSGRGVPLPRGDRAAA
jgi:CheY-like chemotaxis protein